MSVFQASGRGRDSVDEIRKREIADKCIQLLLYYATFAVEDTIYIEDDDLRMGEKEHSILQYRISRN